MNIDYTGMFEKVAYLSKVYFPDKRLRAVYLAAKAHPSHDVLKTPAADHYRKRIDQLHRAIDNTSAKYIAKSKPELEASPSITERQFERLADKLFRKGIAENKLVSNTEKGAYFRFGPPNSYGYSPMKHLFQYGEALRHEQKRLGMQVRRNRRNSVDKDTTYSKLLSKIEG